MTTKDSACKLRVYEERSYKSFLRDLSSHLTSRNIEELMFISGLRAGQCEKINNGLDLLKALDEFGAISRNSAGLDELIDLLREVHRMDLCFKVKEFIKTASEIANKKEASIKSESTKPKENSPSQRKSGLKGATDNLCHPPSYFQIKSKKATDNDDLMTSPSNKSTALKLEDVPPKGSAVMCSEINEETPVPAMNEYALSNTKSLSNVEFALPERKQKTYEMSKDPRGCCLIINNIDFKRSRWDGGKYDDRLGYDDRTGSEVDAENLKKTFKKLKFKPVVENNKTAGEIYDILQQYAKMDYTDFNCFIVCILSHGDYRGLCGVDGEVLELNVIHNLFKNSSSLKEKPKVFFYQFCRGNTEATVVCDGNEPSWKPTDHPTEADFFVAFATPPGYVSWRSKTCGTWFISSLCEELCEDPSREIGSIMRAVTGTITKAYTKDGKKQTPQVVSTLSKDLVFS